MATVHLITTCAKSKNGPVLDTVYPYDIQDTGSAYQRWKQCVQARYETGMDVTETLHLYRGDHWNTARKIAAAHNNISLWVVSAGLGLRHSGDPAIPYESSFTRMSRTRADIWERLITDPVLPGQVSSLEGLLRQNSEDTFIIAASPVYLKAIENDLAKGVSYLPEPKNQLTITTSAAYTGLLKPYVRCGDSSMLKNLNSNMTTLNIKHAESLVYKIIENL